MMGKLSILNRALAIGQLQAGKTVSEVANAFNVSRKAIQNLKKKFRDTGNVKDLPRSGRPKVTTPRQDRRMITSSLRNRFTNGNDPYGSNDALSNTAQNSISCTCTLQIKAPSVTFGMLSLQLRNSEMMCVLDSVGSLCKLLGDV